MGSSRWSPSDWDSYSTTTKSKSTEEIFTKRGMDSEMDPKGVAVRESRDSDVNPNSTAVILGLDVTGSMGVIADKLARESLGVLVEEIYDRMPIPDPHIMVMGIGDVVYDRAPLQVGQFEADLTITKWLEKIWLEHGGGGNACESYDLAYYFAATHTSIDCYEKRSKKGFMFTIGDEPPPQGLTKEQVKEFIGDDLQAPISFAETLSLAQKMYYCFHIIIKQGSHVRMRGVDSVKEPWTKLLGQNVIVLDDYNKIAELVVSTMQVWAGEDIDTVSKSWGGDTEMVVRSALKDIAPSSSSSSGGGTVRL